MAIKCGDLLFAAFILIMAATADVLAAKDRLGSLHDQLQSALELSRDGKSAEARSLAQQTLAREPSGADWVAHLSADDLTIAGKIFYNTRDLALAEKYFRAALMERERLSSPTSVAASLAMGDLAATYREQRRYQEAETLVTESLALRRSLLPANDPYVAASLENLGRTYLATGRYNAAERAFSESRNIFHENFGDYDENVRSEDDLIERAQNGRAMFRTLLELLLIPPILVIGLISLLEYSVTKGLPRLGRWIGIALMATFWGSKALAAFFGAFALMPLLMWALPTPLDASQMRPVAGLIGGVSGLVALFVLDRLALVVRGFLKSSFGWTAV